MDKLFITAKKLFRSYIDKDYVLVYAPLHHKSNPDGFIGAHRLIYEYHYRCCLLDWIVIHHKNHIRYDNRIDNLEPMTHSKHSQIHAKKSKLGYKRRIDMSERLCGICGSKTYVDPTGYENWRIHPITKEFICVRCSRIVDYRIKNNLPLSLGLSQE